MEKFLKLRFSSKVDPLINLDVTISSGVLQALGLDGVFKTLGPDMLNKYTQLDTSPLFDSYEEALNYSFPVK